MQIPSTSVTQSSSTSASPSTSTFVAPKQIHLNTGKKTVADLRSNTEKKTPAESQLQKGAAASSKPENRFLVLQTDTVDNFDALEKEKKSKLGPKIKPPNKAPSKS